MLKGILFDLEGTLTGKFADSLFYLSLRAVLKEFSSRELKLGIVTGASTARAHEFLKLYHLENFFEVVLGYDLYDHPKPSPDGLIKAAILLDLEPRFFTYIGDNTTDMEAAQRAGMAAWSALWFKQNPDILLEDFERAGASKHLLNVDGLLSAVTSGMRK